MKIAMQMGNLPGDTTADKARWARDHGVEGLELGIWGGGLPNMRKMADDINGIVPVVSVCGNCDASGESSFLFLDPDKANRRKSIDGCLAILEFCGEIGATGQIVPPIFGGPKVPDLSPFRTPIELEHELMSAAIREIAPVAAAHNTLFLLEPLNRYEQHYLKKQSDGVAAIGRAGASAGVALLADLFHMHIEETDTPQAIRDAGAHIRHVHLADNTRQEPGSGDIDFVAAFRALHEIGFTGHMAYECGVRGETAAEKAENLAASLEFVRDSIAAARKG